jgi:hypothetical protein
MYPRKQVTPIDQLINLDELEGELQDRDKKFEMVQSKIRHTGPRGGMMGYQTAQQTMIQPPMLPPQRSLKQVTPIENVIEDVPIDIPSPPPPPMFSHQQPLPNLNYNMYNQPDPEKINCLTISQHIDMCPICAKIYGQQEKNMYLLIIAVLVIICLLLFKKFLETGK